MDRIFKSQTRVTLFIAVLLILISWGRLAVMGFVNPSPFRQMRVEVPNRRSDDFASCSGPAIGTSRYIYRLGCDFIHGSSTSNKIMRFDMARGVLDNAWMVDGAQVSAQSNIVLEFKPDADGGAVIGVGHDPEFGKGDFYARLVPGGNAEMLPPPSILPDPPALVSPQSDPASSVRLSRAALGVDWVVYPEIDYYSDDAGNLAAVRLWTGRTNSGENLDNPPVGLVTFNQLGLKGRWVLIERQRGALAGRAGYETVLDDASGDAGGVVPIDGRFYGGFEWRMAIPDPTGGLWLFADEMTYAHFDSSLHRTDPLTIFERFQRMQVDHYRDLTGINWWYADRRYWLEAAGYIVRQAATPVLLLGLPLMALIALWVQRRRTAALPQSFLDSPELRLATQIYMVLFVLFIYWYWLVTAAF